MGALGEAKRDYIDRHLHRLGISEGQHQRRPRASGWADRTEQIGAFVSLVGRLALPRSTLGPLSDDAVLLADARFLIEPDLDRLAVGHTCEMRRDRARVVS